jgi:hypothetical protein
MKYLIKFANIIIISHFLLSCNKSNDVKPSEEIPNAGFENWGTLYDFDKPESWGTSNFSLYSIVTFTTVTKDGIEKYSGNYCPRLETQSQIINNSPVKVVGLITLGQFDINIATRKAKISGGIPFVTKPLEFQGFYKYNGVGNDNCFIDLAITRFNAVSMQQDTIGHSRFSSKSVSEWTPFNVPINYNSDGIPDSMNIVILSSDTSIFETGSTLWVDDLKLNY